MSTMLRRTQGYILFPLYIYSTTPKRFHRKKHWSITTHSLSSVFLFRQKHKRMDISGWYCKHKAIVHFFYTLYINSVQIQAYPAVTHRYPVVFVLAEAQMYGISWVDIDDAASNRNLWFASIIHWPRWSKQIPAYQTLIHHCSFRLRVFVQAEIQKYSI